MLSGIAVFALLEVRKSGLFENPNNGPFGCLGMSDSRTLSPDNFRTLGLSDSSDFRTRYQLKCIFVADKALAYRPQTLRQNPIYNLSMYVCEAVITTLMLKRQLLVINTQLVEDRRVKVMYVHRV